MVRIVETKLNTHACPHSCLLSDPFFDPNSKFVHVNDGLDNKCEKGAPITDVDACKAMAAKTNVPYRGEHRLVYGPTGCIFYNAMYATHSAKDAGIFFLHKNDRVQPMPVKGHFKVCSSQGGVELGFTCQITILRWHYPRVCDERRWGVCR